MRHHDGWRHGRAERALADEVERVTGRPKRMGFTPRKPTTRASTARAALARVKLHERIAKVTGGPIVGRIASQYTTSLAGQSWRPEIGRHVVGVTQVDPPATVDYPFDPSLPPSYRRTKAFDAQPVYRLHDTVLSPFSGLAWFPSGQVVGETVGSLHRLMTWGNLDEPLYPHEPLDVDHPVVTQFHLNYYHWTLESLPALLRTLEQEPDATVLLPARLPPFVEGHLDLALPDGWRERVVRSDVPRRVRDALVTTLPAVSGFVHPDDVDRVRHALLPGAETTAGVGPRVYISRRDTSNRGLSNADAVEAVAREAGFEVVTMADRSAREQIAIVRDARVVVAPHGAGLANVVFASAPQHVLELFTGYYFNDCFARLIVAAGGSYDALTAAADHEGNVVLDLDALRTKLAAL